MVVTTTVVVVAIKRCVVICTAFHFARSTSYFSSCFLNSFKYFLYLKFDSSGFCGLFTGRSGIGTVASVIIVIVGVVVVVDVVLVVVVVVVVVVVEVVVGALVVAGDFPYSVSHLSNDCLYFSFSFANSFKYFLYL